MTEHTADLWTESDVDDLQWAVWFARRVKGTSREVAIRALEQNPALRFTEREAEVRADIAEKMTTILAMEPDERWRCEHADFLTLAGWMLHDALVSHGEMPKRVRVR